MITNFWNEATVDENNTELSGKLSLSKVSKVKVKNEGKTQEPSHELAIDVYETETNVFVVVPLAGVKSADLDVVINENVIHITGERKNPFEEYEDKIYSSECFWGKFERKFTLPTSVDTRNMMATFRNGILLVEADRVAPSGVKRLAIS